MDLLSFSPEQFKSFILILIRISVVLFMLPVFGSRLIPNTLKAGLALVISVLLFPIVQPDPGLFPEDLLSVLKLLVCELVLGLILSLTIHLFFAAVQLSGQIVGFQLGFGMARVLDPESGAQGTMLVRVGYWLATVIFLLLDGHHILLKTLAESFSVIEVGSLGLREGLFHKMLQISGDMFEIAIKLGAPAIAALLFVSAAFGIIAKMVPQMNILMVAFPVKIVVGLLFFGICLEILLYFMKQYVADLEGTMKVIMALVRV